MDHQTTIETLMRRIALSTNDNETKSAARALQAKLRTAGIDPHSLGLKFGEDDPSKAEGPKAPPRLPADEAASAWRAHARKGVGLNPDDPDWEKAESPKAPPRSLSGAAPTPVKPPFTWNRGLWAGFVASRCTASRMVCAG